MPELAEINPTLLATLEDAELISIHRQVHQWWNAGAGNKETVFNAHDFIVAEMKKRDIDHNSPLLDEDWGKEKVEKSDRQLPAPQEFFDELPKQLVLVPDYITVSGSYVTKPDEAKDIDLIVKSEESEAGFASILMKLPRAVASIASKQMHFVSNVRGPTFDYRPLYHLALVKCSPDLRLVDGEPDFTGAIAKAEASKELKATTNVTPVKTETVFFNFDDMWKKWAKKIIDAGSNISVEKKFDGIRAVIHKDGDEIKILTENIDIAEKMPAVAIAVKAQKPESLIIDTELVAYDPETGKPLTGQALAKLLEGKEPVENVIAHTFDLLFIDGEDISQESFTKRREQLEKAIKKGDAIQLVPSLIAKDKKELEQKTDLVSKEVGSTGAMLKDRKSPYELDGETDAWSRLKNLLEVDARVIGFRKVPLPRPENRKMSAEEMEKLLPDLLSGSNTFVYRVSVIGPDGKEIPIEANLKLEDPDLEIMWDVQGQEWRGLDDPAIWTMARGWPDRKAGELAYGTTSAAQLDPRPELGDIISVAPVEIDEFKPGHFSWQFPKVRNVKPEAKRPGDIRDIKPVEKATVKKQKGRDEELELTNEEEQQLAEQAIGDYYMVEEDGGKHSGTVQHHLRGVWTDDDRKEIKAALAVAEDAKAYSKIARAHDIKFLRTTPEQLQSAVENAEVGRRTDVIAAALRPAKLGDSVDKLVNQGSAHTDLRIEVPKVEGRVPFLIGWTLNTPTSVIQSLSDGKTFYPVRDKFLENEEKDNIVSEKKLPQPVRWLTIAKPDKPFVVPPGGVGATKKTPSLFVWQDNVDVVFGVQKPDFHEYFLFFDKHKGESGRWGVSFIDVEGRDFEAVGDTFWQTAKPLNQTPYIQTHDFEKEKEKAKKEKIELVWNEEAISALDKRGYAALKPPEETDQQAEKKAPVDFAIFECKTIAKVDRHFHYILGVAMLPGAVDSYGDIMSEEEIRNAEAEFVKDAKFGEQHEYLNRGMWLENSICLDEPKTFKRVDRKRVTYPKGTWLIKIGIDPQKNEELWQNVLEGKYTGFSIEGFGDRVKLLEVN
jgi:hypothetical protein